jgi:hypothetical protein
METTMAKQETGMLADLRRNGGGAGKGSIRSLNVLTKAVAEVTLAQNIYTGIS